MTAAVAYPHIIKPDDDSARLEKHPRTRVAMIVADYLWRGWSAEEIVRQYPCLTLAETHAALGYYFDNREEIDAESDSECQAAGHWKNAHPSDPLLVRLKARP